MWWRAAVVWLLALDLLLLAYWGGLFVWMSARATPPGGSTEQRAALSLFLRHAVTPAVLVLVVRPERLSENEFAGACIAMAYALATDVFALVEHSHISMADDPAGWGTLLGLLIGALAATALTIVWLVYRWVGRSKRRPI
jgi:hypothetical protein